jgi:aminomethyltransferase
MPIFYEGWGLIKEHTGTRNYAGLFDVSHMGQIKVYGADRKSFVNRIFTTDLDKLTPNNAALSLILNHSGGIIDDSVVTMFEDHYSIVLNAGNKHIDMAHMNQELSESFKGKDIKIETLFDDKALLALQGPKAMDVLQKFVTVDLKTLPFMSHVFDMVPSIGAEVQICRCGYTGEDGFEISVDNDKVVEFAKLLFEDEGVAPAGLGARDSLRLESGLCLHGNDIDQVTTPFEAVLMWTTRKSDAPAFIGKEEVEKRKAAKRTVKRVGFVMDKSGIPRHGADVLDEEGNKCGHVSSGSFSPNLKIGLGMAYVNSKNSKVSLFPLKN